MITDMEYTYVKKMVRDLVKVDLDCYKEHQMRRRLTSFLERNGSPHPTAYFTRIEQDRRRLKELRDFLTINVSEFFRDDRQFEKLRTIILPELLANRAQLNIWSAGCANGSEPYTVAIMLAELSPGRSHRILATDLDDTILARAKAGGPYVPSDVRNVPSNFLTRYFRQSGNEYWIVDKIKGSVLFKQHNLLADSYELNFDLILCRNVVIYFTDEAKQKINHGFYRSLKEGGILFVGGSEIIFNAARIGFESVIPSFYRKLAVSGQQSIVNSR